MFKIQEMLMVFYQVQGKINKAIAVADKALQAKDKTSLRYCGILRQRGYFHFLNGDMEKCLSDVNLALKIAQDKNYTIEQARCLYVLAHYYQRHENDFQKSLNCCQKARILSLASKKHH